jgi:hypothetical protein
MEKPNRTPTFKTQQTVAMATVFGGVAVFVRRGRHRHERPITPRVQLTFFVDSQALILIAGAAAFYKPEKIPPGLHPFWWCAGRAWQFPHPDQDTRKFTA